MTAAAATPLDAALALGDADGDGGGDALGQEGGGEHLLQLEQVAQGQDAA